MKKRKMLNIIFISLMSFSLINTKLYANEYIAYLQQTSTSANIVTNINKFKENLNTTRLLNTSKFFCKGDLTCEDVSQMEYLGLISEAEYNFFVQSQTEIPFFVTTNQYYIFGSINNSSDYKKLTASGISDTITTVTTAGIKVSAYMQGGTIVEGEGTYSNPFVIVEQ